MKDHPARTLAQIALALRRENVLLLALVPSIFCTVLLFSLSQEVSEASKTRVRTPSEHVRKYQRQQEVVLADEPREDFWIEKILDQPRVSVR